MKETKLKIYIETLGCKVNAYESAAMYRMFCEQDYDACNSLTDADLVILNSCTVTENSDRKARAFCRRVRAENPKAVLLVCGCFPQAFHDKALGLEADILMGTGERGRAPAAVNDYLERGEKLDLVESLKGKPFEVLYADELLEHTRAFLKIEDGCERWCSYCAIPKARGDVRSMPLAAVILQAEAFAAKGYKELVLCGINLSAYGMDIGCDLGDAVLACAAVEGIERIRLGSLECDILSDEMLSKFASTDKFCPQFHLSLQSGCDRTLKRMNRRYTAAEYKGICERIRSGFDHPVFTTDIIVGFPGETEEDFRESLEFCKSIGFLRAHVFPYSRRSGTMANALPDQIVRAEKQRRAAVMSAELAKIAREELLKHVGEEVTVILETPEGDGYTGYTERYIPARVVGDGLRQRMLVRGRICCIENDTAVVLCENS